MGTRYIQKEKSEGLFMWKRRRGCIYSIMMYSLDSISKFFFKISRNRLLKSPHWVLIRLSIEALEALEKISADPQNLVLYIISGRVQDGAFLEQYLGHQKNIGFSAELERGGFGDNGNLMNGILLRVYIYEFNLDVGDCRDTPTLFVLYITCVFLSSSLSIRHTLWGW